MTVPRQIFRLLRTVLVPASLGLMVAAGPASPASGQTSSETMRRLAGAWKARQERTRALKFAWTQTSIIEKGTWADPAADPEIRQPLPPKDVTFEAGYFVSLRGDLLRYEFRDQYWPADEQRLVPRTYIGTFDGKKATAYFPVGAAGFPTALIRYGKPRSDFANINVKALLLFCRPASPEVLGQVPLDGFVVAAGEIVVDGHSCIVLESAVAARRPAKPALSFCVDPQRSFIILRCTSSGTTTTGEPFISYQIDVSYQRDARHGWVPSAWKLIYGAGPRQYSAAKVTGYSINPKIDPKEFTQPKFAPGTWITNGKTKQQWLVRKRGSKRRILKREQGIPYEQLLLSNPSDTLIEPKPAKWGWFARLNVVAWPLLACVLAAVLVCRKFSKRK